MYKNNFYFCEQIYFTFCLLFTNYNTMKMNVDRKQLDFEYLKNGLLVVTYKPFSSKMSKKQYFSLFEQHTRYYNLAMKVAENNASWVEINYLAEFVELNHGKVIESI